MFTNQIEDKRVFARLPVTMPVKFMNTEMNAEGEALTQDISAKGIGLMINRKIKPNTSLEMWLTVPDKGEPFYTRGEVIWSIPEADKYRIGVNLERADLMGISRVLRAARI